MQALFRWTSMNIAKVGGMRKEKLLTTQAPENILRAQT